MLLSHQDAIVTLENNDFPTDFAIFTKALRTYGRAYMDNTIVKVDS